MKMINAAHRPLMTAVMTAAALLCAASTSWAAPPDASAPGAVAEANPTKARPTKKKAVKRADNSRDSASRARVTTKKKTAKRRDGAYFNGGLGVVTVSDQPAGVTLDTGTLALIGIGMRVTPDIAIEGNLQAQFHDIQTGQDTASSDTLAGGSLSLKYFFPVMLPRIEGYAQGGLGYISLDGLGEGQEDLSGVTLEVGGGIDYRTSKQFAIGGRVGYSTLLGGALGGADADNNDAGGFSALSAMLVLNLQL
jgi:hypothetical protein